MPSCGAGTTQPYVISADGVLYTFDPPKATFTRIGPVSCWAPGMTLNSMAIGRNGVAFLNYTSNATDGTVTGGTFFKLNVADGSCTPTNVNLPPGWQKVGMAYATASATSTTDILYIAGADPAATCGMPGSSTYPAGVAGVNPTTWSLSKLTPFAGDLSGYSAELTGTGDGRLFAFYITSPARVAQVDLSTGVTSNEVSFPNLVCPWDFAFTFWGGDLYLYASLTMGSDSTVTRYSIATGETVPNYVADVGFQIIGAGVSTCAPTQPLR
jgi:hypothetical protein